MLEKIRKPIIKTSPKNQIKNTFLLIIIGLIIGVLIKWLDENASTIGPIFSEVSVWVLICSTIAAYSQSPKRAAINVFLFSISMLITYYLYSEIAGIYYSLRFVYGWAIFSLFTPFFGYFTWYCKGRGNLPKILKMIIVLFMVLVAFKMFDGIKARDIVFIALTLYILKPDNRK